jgi:hypothetical protein
MILKVISGGQTGVDRAGLDAALKVGFPIGGHCPKGRIAEDGVIPKIYPLIELESQELYYRTEKNVISADGTLILNKGALTHGSKRAQDLSVKYGKPCLVVHLEDPIPPAHVIRWIEGQYIQTLNVAGPRESKFPEGIYKEALVYLEKVFENLKSI